MDDPRAGKIVGTADFLSPEQIRTPLNIGAVERHLLARLHTLLCDLRQGSFPWRRLPFQAQTALGRYPMASTEVHPRLERRVCRYRCRYDGEGTLPCGFNPLPKLPPASNLGRAMQVLSPRLD